MKNYFLFSCLAFFLTLGGCEKDCKNICRCTYGTVSFELRDAITKNDYFTVNPHLYIDNVVMYDELGNYTTINGVSYWKTGSFLPSTIKFDYHSNKDAFGMDKKKTFYLHLDTDIDTIRVEYKVKNECMNMDYMRVFYNNQMVLNEGYQNIPLFGVGLIYK